MLKVQTMGRLAKDAAIYESSTTGTKFLSFTLAVNTKNFNEEKIYWIDVRSFNPNHLKLQKYLTKGKVLAVGGNFNTGTMTDKTGTVRITHSIVADFIDFPNVGGGSQTKTNTTDNTESDTTPSTVHTHPSINTEDDVISMGSIPQTPVTVSANITANAVDNDDELPF